VQVFFWVALVAIAALTAALMMLVATVTGNVLRFAHQDIVSKRLFVLIRRYGLWRGSYHLVRIAWANRLDFLSRRSSDNWKTAFLIVTVPLSGFFAGFFLPAVIDTLLLPQDYSSGLLSDVLTRTSLVGGVIGAILAGYVWLRGLSYVARPSMRLPSELSRAGRDHLMINIYWYDRLRTAGMFSACYPWLFLFVGILSIHNNNDPSTGNPTWYENYPYLLGILFVIGIFLPTMVPALVVGHLIERRMVSARVSEELSVLLEGHDGSGASREDAFPKLIADPLGARKDLAQIAEHLSDAARELDARQMRGFSPHPISTLLRGVSLSIHQFLESEESLQRSVPSELRDTLTMTLSLLSAEHGPDLYHCLAEVVSAFDGKGLPAVELIEKPPGWLAVLASSALATIPRIALVVTSIAATVAIVIATTLTILHRMNIEQLLRFLR
jgi:hypothetical protein